MKLYEKYASKEFHSCITSTFGIDFDAYENIVLSRTRGAGCHNNLVVADSRMLSMALDGASALPRYAGRLYSISGAGVSGVFHPKITVQLGRSKGRVIISSANMTAAGLAGNFELVTTIECGTETGGERTLVASTFRFLSGFFDRNDPTVQRQLDWLKARTSWLREEEEAPDEVLLKDGSKAALLHSGKATGIGRRFIDLVGGQDVHRLIVVSPYWDDDLSALEYLSREMSATETIVLLDHKRHRFPLEPAKRIPSLKLLGFDASSQKGGVAWREERFVHAKLIIAQTNDADHVLFGSANCTVAALGNMTFGGHNAEACLYRALAPGAAVQQLGLASVLAASSLDQTKILPPADEHIPLAELEQRNPGRFSCQFEILTWHLPTAGVGDRDVLELLNQSGMILDVKMQPVSTNGSNEIRYQIASSDRPYFGRIRYASGKVSALAIVHVADVLRDAMRDSRSKKVDAAIAALSDETDVSLWLLETIGQLEAAESERKQAAPLKRTKSKVESDTGETPEVDNVIGYDAFTVGRQLRSESVALSRNSLSGTDLSHVRNFLNRILLTDQPGPPTDDGSEADTEKALATTDEDTDPDNAPEQDPILPERHPRKIVVPDEAMRLEQARNQRRRANRDQLIQAVAQMQRTLKDKPSFTAIDLLRLRALLMVLLAAAWEGKGKPASLLHVLPATGDKDSAWPRLLGKCLFAFFGGSNPAIQRLTLEDCYDQIPVDVLECWASCFWVMQAISDTAARTDSALASLFQHLPRETYARTGLKADEWFDPRVMKVFDALTARFAGPLKLHPEKLFSGHVTVVSSLQADRARQS